MIAQLEERLCAYFGRRHCCVTGRGATALYLALKALPQQGGTVLLPATACPSPANVTLYAGFEPIFCDINLDDYTMDVASLERMLALHDDVAAIMPVHLYGQPADMGRIADVARRRHLPIVEDAAQAMGAEYDGARVGALGELSVVSFGHTKILDVGWGGAVLTDDEALAQRIRDAERALPACPEQLDAHVSEYRRVYYTLRSLADEREPLHALFVPLPAIYRALYLFRARPEWAEAVLARLDGVGAAVRARRNHAELYASRLQHEEIRLPVYRHNGAPWRFSFLLRREIQRQVVEGLRREGIDVSTWYPPLYKWFASGRAQGPRLFPNADLLGRRIINLWVEPTVDRRAIERTCEVLLGLVESAPDSDGSGPASVEGARAGGRDGDA